MLRDADLRRGRWYDEKPFLYALRRDVLRDKTLVAYHGEGIAFLYALRRDVLRDKLAKLGMKHIKVVSIRPSA